MNSQQFKSLLLPELVFVEGGKFELWDNHRKKSQDEEHRWQEVFLNSFWMGKYPVTIAQYLEFVHYSQTPKNYPAWLPKVRYSTTVIIDQYERVGCQLTAVDLPIVGISWEQACAYCNWLSNQTGLHYRLPTGLEWNHAAQGGSLIADKTQGMYMIDTGWFYSNSELRLHAVGKKLPNQLGLYDMLGNVRVWCSDWFHEVEYIWFAHGSIIASPNGLEKDAQERRLVLGCAYNDDEYDYDMVVHRGSSKADPTIGIRVVCEAEKQ